MLSDTYQPKKRALGYLRISDKKQIKGESKANQRASIQAYANSKNIEIIKWFYDEAKSGKNAERDELTNLLRTAVMMKNQIDYVIVYKMSRASRDVSSYHNQIRSVLASKGIMVRSATEQFDDSAMGQFMETLFVSVAQLDNDTKREMVVDNMTRLAQQGYWQHKPIRGYVKHKVKNSEGYDRPSMKPGEEANKIRKLLSRWNRGDITEAELCRYSTMIELLGLNGKPINQDVMHKIIVNPIYAGFVRDKFTNYELVEGKHEGLITPEMYWQNQEILKMKNKEYLIGLKHRKINTMYPLRRFVKCVSCENYLTACAPKNSPRYFCHRPDCRGTGSVMASSLHAKFEDLLKSVEPKPNTLKLMKEIIKRQSVKELGNLNLDISEYRTKLDEIAIIRTQTFKKFISGKIGEDDKQMVIDDLDNEKLELSTHLTQLEQQQTLNESQIDYALNFMGNIAKTWYDAPLEIKQTFQNLIFPEGFIYDIKNDNFITTKISPLYTCITSDMEADYDKNFVMVSSRILQWNSLEENLLKLYSNLSALGMEYRNDTVYIADLEEKDV